jgi:ABC-type transporter Mla MlaB component
MTTSTSEPVGVDGVCIELKGSITAYTAAPVWRSALETLARNPDRPIIVDASHVEHADDVGIALLFDLIRRDRPATAAVEIRSLAPNLAVLVHAQDPKDFVAATRNRSHPGVFELS